MNSRAKIRERGFTLLEMMVVIAIILILLAVAMPVYSHSIARAREENLRRNLDTMNQMIFQYAQDRQKSPQSLNDLKTAGYLKSIPEDITGREDTWETEDAEGTILSLDQTETGGIIGVHSGSSQIGSDGKAYSTW
jgi:general secretion pathway protein G